MEKLHEKHGVWKQSAKTGSRMAIRFIAVIIAISAAAAMLTACGANNDARNTESAAIEGSTVVAESTAAAKSTIVEESAAVEESFTTEPVDESLWIDNVLMPDEVFDSDAFSDYIINSIGYYEAFVLGSTIPRRQIHSITFLDTLKDAPAGSWDVSEQQDGSVRAWVTDETDLFIGANGGINAKYCKNLFYSYLNVSEINFNHCFHTNYAVSMRSMFAHCHDLIALDLSHFNTVNVADMGNMFFFCESLTNLDLSSFDTSGVTNMHSMFTVCPKLTSFDISNFDTSNVTDMGAMFSGCEAESLDLRSFDTSSVTDMDCMFAGCRLTNLDLSGFDTSLVTNMSRMFYRCYALTDLNVSNFRTSNVVSMENMFSGSSKLENISGIEHFDTRNVIDYKNFMEPGKMINGHPWEELIQFRAAEKPQFIIDPAAKEGLISILADYQSEYGEEFGDGYGLYSDGDAAFLADLDGDGTDELVLNKWHESGDEDHDGFPDQVITYCVFDYQNGTWRLRKESKAIGSVSFAGSSGRTHCVYKDGKAVLAVLEWRSPYGTGGGPGQEETQTLTLYNNITQQIATFAVTTANVGYYDDDRYPITTDMAITYKVNGARVSYDQFVQKLSAYEGITYHLGSEGAYLSFDNWSGLMPSDLIRELRES